MDATYRREISQKGFRLDVLKSGLQKYIRRGNTEMAFFCCSELDGFSKLGLSRDTKRIRTNMIHRLLIIFVEDIGLGGMNLIPIFFKNWLEWSRNFQPVHLKNMIWVMCQSKKTRACSFAKGFAFCKNLDRFKEDKDYEKAKHDLNQDLTLEKSIEQKSWKSIEILVKMLCVEKVSKKVYTDIFKLFSKNNLKYSNQLFALCREINTKEKFIYPLLCLLFHIFGGVEDNNISIPVFENNWEKEEKMEIEKFDEYVYDKHTKSGKNSREYFVRVSSTVNNEVDIVPELFKKIYSL